MKVSIVAFVMAVALLSGCKSLKGDDKLQYTDYAGEPVKSFQFFNFDGWTAVNNRQLVVWSGVNKAYLLTVSGYCPDLKYANAIGVTSTAGQVDKFEKVLVGRDRCFIEEIRPVDIKQMKADRKALREQVKPLEDKPAEEKPAAT
jgi:hypothetical protein